jgi:Fur family transcriptional regulator, ferric uptake regulator
MPHCHTFIEALYQRGYRITPQREIIIQTIAHSGRHMTAEEVHAVVHTRAHAINIATVYRTLDFLVKEGLSTRLDLGSGKTVYATAKHGPHIHLVCRQCGAVIEATHELLAPLQQHIQQQYGFQADLHHISLAGLCAACADSEAGGGATGGEVTKGARGQ